MTRSASGISAIFASNAASSAAFLPPGPLRLAAFSSWARSFIAARSSALNTLDVLPFVVALLAVIVPPEVVSLIDSMCSLR